MECLALLGSGSPARRCLVQLLVVAVVVLVVLLLVLVVLLLLPLNGSLLWKAIGAERMPRLACRRMQIPLPLRPRGTARVLAVQGLMAREARG